MPASKPRRPAGVRKTKPLRVIWHDEVWGQDRSEAFERRRINIAIFSAAEHRGYPCESDVMLYDVDEALVLVLADERFFPQIVDRRPPKADELRRLRRLRIR